MINRGQKRKDLALTTLIDLLVQIVFLLAFVIVISNVVLGSTTEPDYKDLWRHLIESIFDRKIAGNPKEQTTEAVANVKNLKVQVEQLKAQVEKLKEELDKCKGLLSACKSELDKSKGGGGPVACDMKQPMLQVTVTGSGKVSVAATDAGSLELAKLGVTGLTFGTPMDGEEFRSVFGRITSQQPSCRYRVNVACEDRNLPTWQYETNLRIIMGLFSTPNSQRTCR